MTVPRVLNVGGNSREIPLPPEYAGWDNVLLDIDPGCNPDVLCDARELDRLPAASFDSVYCSHNLEHYYQHDVARVLAGFQHVLKDEGFVFVRVPDIVVLMRVVVEQGLDITDILYQSNAGPITVRDVIYGYGREIERSGNDFFAHKTGFTEKSLLEVLHAAGFPHVFTRYGFLEVTAFAFKNAPTAHAVGLLKLPAQAEYSLRAGDELAADCGQDVSMPNVQAGQPEALEARVDRGTPRRLHIGGTSRAEGWEILNVIPASCVDHVGNANDLSRFSNETFLEIYASHVVEHLDYKYELMETLKEWHRVLEPGGRVMISVPDLDALAGLLLVKNELTVEQRFFVMRMIFGGHIDEHDYHVVGLNQEFLAQFLGDSGYAAIRRVDSFGLFDDMSAMDINGVAVSLNMIAEKPRSEGSNASALKAESKLNQLFDSQNARQKGRTRNNTDNAVVVKMADGISISVPDTLRCISTYVLLEQERWFEKEVDFIARWLRPGMNVIDIGANVGVYSLPIARAVSNSGRVFAFEPGVGARGHLEASRLRNALENLQILPCALSDAEKEGWLQDGSSSELNSLGAGCPIEGNGERVRVTSLDIQERELQWPSIDFIKIDAEGQEERIVAGGRGFFSSHSPLVMYEVKHGSGQSNATRWILEVLGYRTYRLLGDASCLVPVVSDEQMDSYELNLFAAKPDRAAILMESGFLAEPTVAFALSSEERAAALRAALSQPYARAFEFSIEDISQCPFGEAFVAYAAYKHAGLDCARRHAALTTAFDLLSDYCRIIETPAGLATLARVALDLGHRDIAVGSLKKLVSASGVEIDQPFYPPCERYEQLSPEGRESEWFVAAANEQFELSRSHSSRFQSGALERLNWLCNSPFSSAAINRRLILESARQGRGLPELIHYLNPEYEHQNPGYWTAAGLPQILRLR